MADILVQRVVHPGLAVTATDDRGEQLSGARTYTLRLHPSPPVKAFWSLAMYSVPDFYLVENPIHRYSIGDRTAGVILDDDGALTITISHERPNGDKQAANTRPSPAGDFRPVMHVRTRCLDPRPDLRVPGDHADLMGTNKGYWLPETQKATN